MKIIKDAAGTTYSQLVASDFADFIKVSYSGSVPTDLQSSLNAAAAYVEKISWQRLSTRSVVFIADAWGSYEFTLPMSGVLSSPTCTYYDANNASQSLTITSSWVEKTGEQDSIFHLIASSYPALYDRKDAITVLFTLTPYDTSLSEELKIAIYMLAAYYYDCRVNDKDVVMTVVDKIVMAVRHKEF